MGSSPVRSILGAALGGAFIAVAFILVLAAALAVGTVALIVFPPYMFWQVRKEYLRAFDQIIADYLENIKLVKQEIDNPVVAAEFETIFREELAAWEAKRAVAARQWWRVWGGWPEERDG